MFRFRASLITVCALLALPLLVEAQESTPSAASTPDLPRVVEQVIVKTNEFRRHNLRHPVARNTQLTQAAQYFAKYLAEKDQLSHTADGQEPWDRAKKYGYDYCIVEENIAYELNSAGFTTDALADALVKGWEQSPGHRKNMLNRYVTDTGVAVAHSSASGKYYAVQMFGRPKSEEIEFQVINDTDQAVKYKVDGRTLTVEPRVRMTHRACTPPEVQFQLGGKDRVLHPEKGSRYVLRSNQGSVAVSEERK